VEEKLVPGDMEWNDGNGRVAEARDGAAVLRRLRVILVAEAEVTQEVPHLGGLGNGPGDALAFRLAFLPLPAIHGPPPAIMASLGEAVGRQFVGHPFRVDRLDEATVVVREVPALDPRALRSSVLQVVPRAELNEVLVNDGHLAVRRHPVVAWLGHKENDTRLLITRRPLPARLVAEV